MTRHGSPAGSATPIRACMVSYYFAPDYSGSAIQARNLSRHLVGHGIDATIVSANLRGSAPTDVVDGTRVYRLPVITSGELRIPSFWVSLLTFLVRHRRQFDIIHAHGMLPHGTAAIAGRWLGIPTIMKVAMANSDIAFARQGRVIGGVNRYCAERFDRYIATTEPIFEEFATSHLDVSRVRRIPNGVDTDRHTPLTPDQRIALRRTLGLPAEPLVLYVGIVNRRKNVDGALRIWRSAVQAGAPGHLALVGPAPDNDPFVDEVRAQIASPDLAGRVSMPGFRDDVASYLQAADVFLFPSTQEGMPNVVLEAMASGVPPLVSSSAGVDAIVEHGRNGLSLPVADETAFAQALRTLLDEPQRAAALGAEARRTIESRFSLASVAASYATLYREMVKGGSRR